MSQPILLELLLIFLLQPLKESRFRIPKSRYDSVDLYISNDGFNRPEYNDNYLPYDESIYDRLRAHGNRCPYCIKGLRFHT